MATDEPVRVITGASAGIGRALAKRLASGGVVALAVLRLMSAPVDRVADRIVPLVLDDAYASAHGQFFHKGRPIDPPKSTRDVDEQLRLWQVSQQLTGLV
jgi:NAD(P)-dependent dehydrogenase (short-subunit alcohol dehydrogenase family)